MRLDGAIFAIEQRTVGGCIDLATVFLRAHFLQVMQLVAVFAVPSVWLAWWLVDSQEWTLFGCALLFVVESPLLGAALVVAAGHRVFGESFSPVVGLRVLGRRFILFLPLLLALKIVTGIFVFMFVIPAYLLSARYGFLSEVLLLENCPARKYESRLNDLVNQNFFQLLGRLLAVMSFFCVTWLAMFLFVDLTSDWLLNYPILIGRISGTEYFADEIFTLLTVDPRVTVAAMTLAWLLYPLARLAWMFCYLDTRIRKEGWDIELDFRIEAQRLEAAA